MNKTSKKTSILRTSHLFGFLRHTVRESIFILILFVLVSEVLFIFIKFASFKFNILSHDQTVGFLIIYQLLVVFFIVKYFVKKLFDIEQQELNQQPTLSYYKKSGIDEFLILKKPEIFSPLNDTERYLKVNDAYITLINKSTIINLKNISAAKRLFRLIHGIGSCLSLVPVKYSNNLNEIERKDSNAIKNDIDKAFFPLIEAIKAREAETHKGEEQ